MTTYVNVFDSANIYPGDISYSSVVLATSIALSWPRESNAAGNLVTRIMDVTASSAGLSITMPSALEIGAGETILFNNYGANDFVVLDKANVQIASIASGAIWQLYVTSNTTLAGTWRALQYGAAAASANASALAGTGLVAVGSLLSTATPVTSFNANFTASVNDRAKLFVWTGGGGGGVLTLDSVATLGNNWFVMFRNAGSGAVTVTPTSGTLDGAASLSFQPGESATLITDGTNFFSVGFGKNAVFAFDYTVVAVPGTGTYTLLTAEQNRVSYSFTGLLTGNKTVVVPTTVQQYWVTNNTTGAYTLTVKTAAGTGIEVVQGASAILYCNGTNVVKADTGGIATPVSILNGGTGATTAGAALINLGGSSLGITLFQAVDAAVAYSALGRPATITGGTF